MSVLQGRGRRMSSHLPDGWAQERIVVRWKQRVLRVVGPEPQRRGNGSDRGHFPFGNRIEVEIEVLHRVVLRVALPGRREVAVRGLNLEMFEVGRVSHRRGESKRRKGSCRTFAWIG